MDYLSILKQDADLAQKVYSFCDFRLADEQYPLDTARGENASEPFLVFGTDGSGAEFGFIGTDDMAHRPIGYVGTEGEAGRIAENIDDFFHLLLYRPIWHDVLSNLSLHGKETSACYYGEQLEIANKLNLTFESDTLEKLSISLSQEPRFKVYAPDGWEYNDLLPHHQKIIEPALVLTQAPAPANVGWSIRPFEGVGDISFGISQENLKSILGEPDDVYNTVTHEITEYREGMLFIFRDIDFNQSYALHAVIFSEKCPLVYDGIDIFHQNNAIRWLARKDKPIQDKGTYVMFPNLGFILGGFEEKVSLTDMPKVAAKYSEFLNGRFVILFSRARSRFYQIFMNA